MPLSTFYLTSLLICLIIVSLVFCLYVLTKNASIIDTFWSVGISAACLIICVTHVPFSWVQYAPLILIQLWGIRLASFMFVTRILKNKRDPRYERLIQNRPRPRLSAMRQYILQAALQSLLTLSVFPMFTTPLQTTPWFYVAFGVGIGAIIFESFADIQLHRFKATQSGNCNVGLWSCSRHPNYFFDCLFWLGCSLFYIGVAGAYISFIAPITIFIITYFITGPYTERCSIDRHGDAYRDYQQIVPYFFILPKFNK